MYASAPLGPATTRSAHWPGNFLGSFVGEAKGKVATNVGSGPACRHPPARRRSSSARLVGGRWRPDITYSLQLQVVVEVGPGSDRPRERPGPGVGESRRRPAAPGRWRRRGRATPWARLREVPDSRQVSSFRNRIGWPGNPRMLSSELKSNSLAAEAWQRWQVPRAMPEAGNGNG